jgi:hypothetical protein
MSGNLTTTEANRLIDAVLGTTTYTNPTGPVQAAFVTANGSAGTAGTEVVGGSYARQTITAASASAESAANTALIRVSNMPACVVAGVEVWDSAGSPRRMLWGPLTSTAYAVVASTDIFTSATHGMANGDPVQFITGQSPTGLTANTTYYVVATATNTFQLAATVGGSAVNVTADGSGVFTKCKSYAASDAAEIAISALVFTLG